MAAPRRNSVAVCTCVAAVAIGGFKVLNRPHQAAAAQPWSTQRLAEHVDAQPIHMEQLVDAGVRVVTEGRQSGSRWAKLRLTDGGACHVYIDEQNKIDTVLGMHDPRGTWNDAVPIPDYP